MFCCSAIILSSSEILVSRSPAVWVARPGAGEGLQPQCYPRVEARGRAAAHLAAAPRASTSLRSSL